jgi:hypothetical protein
VGIDGLLSTAHHDVLDHRTTQPHAHRSAELPIRLGRQHDRGDPGDGGALHLRDLAVGRTAIPQTGQGIAPAPPWGGGRRIAAERATFAAKTEVRSPGGSIDDDRQTAAPGAGLGHG